MSEEFRSEPPSEIEPAVALATTASQKPPTSPPAQKSGWRAWVAPAWFLLGVLVGLGAFVGYNTWTTKPAAPQALDAATIKQAAKDGFVEALQELQAQSQQGQGSQPPQTVAKDAFSVRPANRLGSENARVTLIEFADFQCPFCARYHQQVAPALIQEYVNTGKVNIVYKHLAFLGPESAWSAVASECAADQGKFWQYHDYLFEHQAGENEGAFNKDKLIGFGKELGLEMIRFEKCVQNDETLDRVRADTAEGQKYGVSSTPTFFVNGTPLVGLRSPDEFKQLIDKALTP